MNFGEKQFEYSTNRGEEIPVWQSPKYLESKAKAEEIINSGKYGVNASDFWILMNESKTGKMVYTGLIISHNGCLKINDNLESKFNPACVAEDKDGYNGSLVYSYCNPEQGIYEVGEVSAKNCKNGYPYAMAYKRLFDRVVLKLSKLAYAGIYSDSEADEFERPLDQDNATGDEPKKPKGRKKAAYICAECGAEIEDYFDGLDNIPAAALAKRSSAKYGRVLCIKCAKKAK